MADDKVSLRFDLKKIYLKDLSFESPKSPGVFTQQQMNPEIDIQLSVSDKTLDSEAGFYEVVLGITVTAKQEEETLFLIEVKEAGVFQINGVAEDEMPMAMQVACPNVILPFAREVVSDMATRGGFPQLLINPINFESLYQQKKNKQTAETVE